MRISAQPESFYWNHPEFRLAQIYTEWCGFHSVPKAVPGNWQRDWIPSGTASADVIAAFQGGRSVTTWVANQEIKDHLEVAGFSDVRVIGMPAVYCSVEGVKRREGSYLILVGEGSQGGEEVQKNVEQFLAARMESAVLLKGNVTVALSWARYRSEREWVWKLRFQGCVVVPFFEDALCGGALREAAVLFASHEYVCGNFAGHWMPHAAFRGAKLKWIDSSDALQWGSALLNGLIVQASDLQSWGAAELGYGSRLEPGLLRESFGWPALAKDTQLERPRSIGGVLEAAPQQMVEEAVREGRLEEIVAVFENDEAQSGGDLDRLRTLVLLRLGQGKRFQAARLFDEASKERGLDAACLVLWSELLLEQKRFSDAGNLLRQAIEQNPDHPGLFVSSGRLSERIGKLELSQQFYSIGLGLARPLSPTVIWSNGSTGSGVGRMLMVSCTAKSRESVDSLMIVESYRKHLSREEQAIDFELVVANRKGLPEVYNAKLEEASEKGYEFVVFVHDDVDLEDADMAGKVRGVFRDFGFHIIGIAGGCQPEIGFPSLWHRMCPEIGYRGFVANCSPNRQIIEVSRFGASPAETDLLDGVFLAIHVPSVMSVGWRFNEVFRFHHYDLAGSLDAKKKGLKIGVAPIHLIHMSPGLSSTSDPEWSRSDAEFLSLYGGTAKGE